MSKLQDKFNFFVPATFEKSGDDGEMKISGVCSSNVEDSDGEFLDPAGFDFNPLLKTGFYNWNHQANKNPGAILGRPTTARVINNGKDFYTEGFLYKGLQDARDLYNLAKVLEAEDPDRRLGFSIEGQAVERDPINPKRIRKARITGVAITHCPKNPNTLLSIIKGEYSEPFQETNCNVCKEPLQDGQCIVCQNKSMTTANIPLPESVEGKPKYQIDQDKLITKSEVYNLIFERYTNDIEKSKDIYSFVQQVSTKLFNMKDNQINKESLQKAFDLLDQSISKGGDTTTTTTTEQPEETTTTTTEAVNKSEDVTTTTTTEKEETAEEKVEKSKARKEEMSAIVKGMLGEGKNRGECIDTMVQKGYDLEESKEVVEKSLNEHIGGTLTKAQLDDLSKGINDNTDSLIKGLVNELNPRFKALGEILKSQGEQNKLLLEQNEELKKSNEELNQAFKTLEKDVLGIKNTPLPRKSLTNANVREKFQKSEDGQNAHVYDLGNRQHRQALSAVLFDEFQKGGPNSALLEKSVMDLEISKSLPANILPVLKQLNIEVFVPGQQQ